MKDEYKIEEQLTRKLAEMRQRIVELEKSKTECKRMKQEFKALKDFNESIIENSPIGIHVVDRAFIVRSWNVYFEDYTGIKKEDIIGKNLFEVVPGLMKNGWDKHYPKVIETGETFESQDYRYIRSTGPKKGEVLHLNLRIVPLKQNGNTVGAITILEDVTEYKKVEKSLRESVNFAQTVINGIGDPTLVINPSNYRIVMANQAMLYQFCREDPIALSLTCYKVSHHRDRPCDELDELCPLKQVINTRTQVRVTHTHLDVDNNKLFIDIIATPVFDKDGKVVQVIESCRDITKSKRAEEELRKHRELLEELVEERTTELTKSNRKLQQEIIERQKAEEELKSSHERLRNLSVRLQSVREEERTLIAREIHDELGQILTALKMDLSWLSKKLPSDGKSLLEKTKSMSKIIDTSIQTVRRISTELRPKVLDDLGIVAAIEWQAEEFQNRTGIKCEVTLNSEDIILDDDRSTAIFRILQETLTNVARHANATKVKVILEEKDGKLVLKVIDNGKGITEKQIFNPKSLGLIGIKERVHFLKGDVKIIGIPGEGTTVTVWLPLYQEENFNVKNIHR